MAGASLDRYLEAGDRANLEHARKLYATALRNAPYSSYLLNNYADRDPVELAIVMILHRQAATVAGDDNHLLHLTNLAHML
ncbi:MAG: hypothetical protein ACRDTH_17580 [Pseudonocardiaceae bacterium]